MYALGKHVIADFQNCTTEQLGDLAFIENVMLAAAKQMKVTVIEHFFKQFEPHGISGAIIIAESHLTIHTWPEYGYAAVDIFTCGDSFDPSEGVTYLAEKLACKNPTILEIKRGLLGFGDQKLFSKPPIVK